MKIPANSEFEKILMLGIQIVINDPEGLNVYKTYVGGYKSYPSGSHHFFAKRAIKIKFLRDYDTFFLKNLSNEKFEGFESL